MCWLVADCRMDHRRQKGVTGESCQSSFLNRPPGVRATRPLVVSEVEPRVALRLQYHSVQTCAHQRRSKQPDNRRARRQIHHKRNRHSRPESATSKTHPKSSRHGDVSAPYGNRRCCGHSQQSEDKRPTRNVTTGALACGSRFVGHVSQHHLTPISVRIESNATAT